MCYWSHEAERAILETHAGPATVEELAPVTSAAEVVAGVHAVADVHVADNLKAYVVDLVTATRQHRDLALGVSPRGALALQRAARALAASVGRDYVVPDDVKRLAVAVLEHRLLLAPNAQLRG